MMRLELFVDDKHLAKVLHAIDGMVVQMQLGPVHNALKKNGKLTGAGQPTTGREVIQEVIRASMAAGQKGAFTTVTARQVASNTGINKKTVHTTIFNMKRQKLLKRIALGKYGPTSAYETTTTTKE